MSLVDNSDENQKSAFTSTFDWQALHRQLKLSLLLIAAMALAAFALAFALLLDAAPTSSMH